MFAFLGILKVLIEVAFEPKSIVSGVSGVTLFILFILTAFLSVRTYRNQVDTMSFGKGLKVAIFVGLLGGLIAGIYAMIYYKFINPDAVDTVLSHSQEILEDWNMTPDAEELANQQEIAKNIFIPIQFVAFLFTGLLYGLIGGVIGGLVYQTPNEDY